MKMNSTTFKKTKQRNEKQKINDDNKFYNI